MAILEALFNSIYEGYVRYKTRAYKITLSNGGEEDVEVYGWMADDPMLFRGYFLYTRSETATFPFDEGEIVTISIQDHEDKAVRAKWYYMSPEIQRGYLHNRSHFVLVGKV